MNHYQLAPSANGPRYQLVLFDLDGTLSESGEGILGCVRQVFAEMGRPLPDEKTLGTFIGPPMYDSLRRCGFSHEEAEHGVVLYKQHFIEEGIYHNKTYDGIWQVLQTLHEAGVKLAVATTKYYPFAEKIIHMLNIDGYFDFIGGATSGVERRTKAKVIRYVLEQFPDIPAERVVMIGDTKYDAEGAAQVGIDFIGCLYGYGTKEEMTAFCPSAPYVDKPADLTALCL